MYKTNCHFLEITALYETENKQKPKMTETFYKALIRIIAFY